MKSDVKLTFLTIILIISWILLLAVIIDNLIHNVKANLVLIFLLPCSFIGYCILRRNIIKNK